MQERRQGLGGMTVNERLVVAGFIESWDRAIAQGDREQAIELLARVELENQAAAVVDALLARAAG